MPGRDEDFKLLQDAVNLIISKYESKPSDIFFGPPQFIRDCYQIRQNLSSYEESKKKHGDSALYTHEFSRIKISGLFKPEFNLILRKLVDELDLEYETTKKFYLEVYENRKHKKNASFMVFLKAISLSPDYTEYACNHYRFLEELCFKNPLLFETTSRVYEIYNRKTQTISRISREAQFYPNLIMYLQNENGIRNFLEFIEILIENFPNYSIDKYYKFLNSAIEMIGLDKNIRILEPLVIICKKFNFGIHNVLEFQENINENSTTPIVKIIVALNTISNLIPDNFFVNINTTRHSTSKWHYFLSLSNIVQLILTSEMNKQGTSTFNDEEFRNFFSQVFKKFLNINKEEISTVNKLIESGNLTDIKRLTLFLNFVEISATESPRDEKSLELLIDYFSKLDDSVVSSGVDSKKLLEYKKAFKSSKQNGDGILSVITAVKLCSINDIESIGRLRKAIIFKNTDTPEFSISIEEFLISMKQRIISEIQSNRDRFNDKNMDFFLNYIKTLDIINKILSVNDLTEVNKEPLTTNDSALIDKMKNIYWYDRNLHFTKAVSRVFDGSVSELENPHVQELNPLIYSGKKRNHEEIKEVRIKSFEDQGYKIKKSDDELFDKLADLKENEFGQINDLLFEFNIAIKNSKIDNSNDIMHQFTIFALHIATPDKSDNSEYYRSCFTLFFDSLPESSDKEKVLEELLHSLAYLSDKYDDDNILPIQKLVKLIMDDKCVSSDKKPRQN